MKDVFQKTEPWVRSEKIGSDAGGFKKTVPGRKYCDVQAETQQEQILNED
ncbi:MAG: hypothetical protein Ct9H90mP8_0700 [Pseudomonadota bacterium]|nr:MAG: hypothetical protein Ct9H90mP8_0700 [Pseudomonadota bacterium]